MYYIVPSKYEILIKVVIGEFGLLTEPLNLIHLKCYMPTFMYAMHRKSISFWNGTERSAIRNIVFPQIIRFTLCAYSAN